MRSNYVYMYIRDNANINFLKLVTTLKIHNYKIYYQNQILGVGVILILCKMNLLTLKKQYLFLNLKRPFAKRKRLTSEVRRL